MYTVHLMVTEMISQYRLFLKTSTEDVKYDGTVQQRSWKLKMLLVSLQYKIQWLNSKRMHTYCTWILPFLRTCTRNQVYTARSFLYCDERFHACYFSVFHSACLTTYTRRVVLSIITGPPNEPVLFCSLSSVVSSSSVTLPAGGRAGRVDSRAADTARRASSVTSR